ncbi:hypothetical protein [Hydrogenophaga aquatica]
MPKVKNTVMQTGSPEVRKLRDGADVQLTTVIPVKITRHKFTRVIVQPGQAAPNNWQAQMDAKLMKALCMALYWQEQLDSGGVESMAAIAKREGMEKMRVHKIMKLARLAPHYVEAIARGQGPIGLSFEFFVRKILPHDWRQQEVVIEALAG